MKPLYIMGGDHALTIHPLKAKYGNKKDYLTVSRTGCLMLEFIPLGNTGSINSSETGRSFKWTDKQGFVVDPKKCAQLLLIEAKRKESFMIEFQYSKDGQKKLLTFESAWDKGGVKLNFSNTSVDNVINYDSIIPPVDFLLVQKMIDYSLPYMMGWNILDNSNISPEDILKE